MSRSAEFQSKESENNPSFEIIGSGGVGDKAFELLKKTGYLESLGFRFPKRTVLAEGFFNDFFSQNNFGPNLQEAVSAEVNQEDISKGRVPLNIVDVSGYLSKKYEGIPLVVRSSANGDCRGTGIYASDFINNSPERIMGSIINVLASYFSADASSFRRDIKRLETGFGMIIEPLIGQKIGEATTPLLSGFGYTSTSRGQGYISAVPGLGGGVSSRHGEVIDRSKIEKYDGALGEYLDRERNKILFGFAPYRTSRLLRNSYSRYENHYTGLAFFDDANDQEAGLRNFSFVFSDTFYKALQVNLLPLFDHMDDMEGFFGRPQYFEWAMTLEDEKPDFWLIQIADIDKKVDVLEFGDHEKIVFTGHSVVGTGEIDITKIVLCKNPQDIIFLRQFNQENQGYAVLFSGSLISRTAKPKLGYADYSNASVFLEIPDFNHVDNSVSHFNGQLDQANKLFAILHFGQDYESNFSTGVKALPILEGDFRIIASERQNRLVVYNK